MRRVIKCVSLLTVLATAVGTSAAAQNPRSDRGPQFYLAPSRGGPPIRVESSDVAILRQRVSIDLEGATLDEVLRTISTQAGIRFVYSADVVPLASRTSLKAERISVAAALTEALLDANVDVVLSDNQAALVPRSDNQAARVRRVQLSSVAGRVSDSTNGAAVARAEVFLEGTRWRTTASADGRYRLADVEPGSYTLSVRRLGYSKRSQALTLEDGREVTVNVALQPAPSALDAVVVTVTGNQRLRELGHVVGRIKADSLVKEAPISTVTELLTARVPGLLVQQRQGTVGGEVKLQIRSANSVLLSNEPIVVVDGIRYNTNPRTGPDQTYTLGPFVGGNEGTSRLNDLNPNDIESIEVVKGPSAATLYGTDAANGVIVITTKRGRPGPARWSVYTRAEVNEIAQERFPDIWWGWSAEVFGDSSLATRSSCNLRYEAAGFCRQDSVSVLANPLNDPAQTIFNGRPTLNYGVNVAGGQPSLRYYFSTDFSDATGPIRLPTALVEELKLRRGVSDLPEELREPNKQTSANLRGTVNVGIGQRAELAVTVGYTDNAARTLVHANPYAAAAYAATPGGSFTSDPAFSPEISFSQTSTERINRFTGSANLEWNPWTWLRTHGTVGLDLTSSNRYSLGRSDEGSNPLFPTGVVGDERTHYQAGTAALGVTVSREFGRLSSRSTVGGQYVRNLHDAVITKGTGLPPGGSSVNDAAFKETAQRYQETVTLGSYAEQVLGLNGRLFVTGALRMDGATGFGRDYDVAIYPKAGVSWVISEEPFVPRFPGLDEVRLRYAFGASGHQPWPQWQRRGFGIGQTLADGQEGNAVAVFLGNPDLRPERVREHEFGVDATALRGRIGLDLTWNHRRTLDQLTTMNLPPGFGSPITVNLGRIDGRGFEARLSTRLLDSRLLSWNLVASHARHTNTLVDLGTGVPGNTTTFAGYAEGYPLGSHFSLPLLSYSDANGDGIIEPTEVQLGDSMVFVGRSLPPQTQALSTTVGFFQERLRVTALLDRQSGFVRRDAGDLLQCLVGVCRAAVDRSAPLAEQAVVAAYQAPGGESRFSRFEPGDFTRLREVTLTVDLPDRLRRAAQLGQSSLSVSSRNLALWTAYRGDDPESEHTAIPQARTWVVRLDVSF